MTFEIIEKNRLNCKDIWNIQNYIKLYLSKNNVTLQNYNIIKIF